MHFPPVKSAPTTALFASSPESDSKIFNPLIEWLPATTGLFLIYRNSSKCCDNDTEGVPPKMFDLSRKYAVVTGAGSGIGEAIARVFTDAGAAVFVLDRDASAAKRVAEKLPNAKAIVADVSDENSVNQAVGNVLEQTDRQIDVLVNNAGIGHVGTVLTTTPADL